MFQPSGIHGVISARCNRVSLSLREYIGYNHATQGRWDKDFYYSVIQDPLFGFQEYKSSSIGGGGSSSGGDTQIGWSAEETVLKATVASINKLRPRLVIAMIFE